MEFFETVAARRSIRAFEKKEVEREKINQLLEAVNQAPSAGDLQAYEVVLVKDQHIKEALASAAFGQYFIAMAPLVLVFLADSARSSAKYGNRGASLYAIQDATIAAAYAQLAATALGLGSVWVGAFEENAVAKLVRASEWQKPIAIIPVGYAAEKPGPTPRRSLSDVVKKL